MLELLNDALATELVCVLRYRRHYFMASGLHARAAAEEFLEHATEEQEHADQIAQRIVQLGGEPDLEPGRAATRSHSEYVEGDVARRDDPARTWSRSASRSRATREMIRYIGDGDPTTRRMMEEILAKEEEHADDMADLLRVVGG